MLCCQEEKIVGNKEKVCKRKNKEKKANKAKMAQGVQDKFNQAGKSFSANKRD